MQAGWLRTRSIDGLRTGLEAMREAGRKTAQTRFCSSLVVPHYVRYYEEVLGQAG